MNSSSLARSPASSLDRPAASYCAGVRAFSSPGNAGVSVSVSAPGSGTIPRPRTISELSRQILFISVSAVVEPCRDAMSKPNRAVAPGVGPFFKCDLGTRGVAPAAGPLPSATRRLRGKRTAPGEGEVLQKEAEARQFL